MIQKIKEVIGKIKYFISYNIFYFRFYRDKRVKALNYLLNKKITIANSYCIFNKYGFPVYDIDSFINNFQVKTLDDEFSYSFYRDCMESRQRKVRVYDWFKLDREIDEITLINSERNFELFLDRIGQCYEKICLDRWVKKYPHNLESIIMFTADIVVDMAEYHKKKTREKLIFNIKEFFSWFK